MIAAITDPDLDRLAHRRAKAKLGWFRHAAIYVLVNLGLIAMSLRTGQHWWIFPLLGWGVGLALHGLKVWLMLPGGVLLDRMSARERTRLQRLQARTHNG